MELTLAPTYYDITCPECGHTDFGKAIYDIGSEPHSGPVTTVVDHDCSSCSQKVRGNAMKTRSTKYQAACPECGTIHIISAFASQGHNQQFPLQAEITLACAHCDYEGTMDAFCSSNSSPVL